MGTISVYNDEDNKTYKVTANLKQGLLAPDQNTDGAGKTLADVEFYIEITTDIKKPDGTAYGKFIVRSLADVAPSIVGSPSFTPNTPATGWTQLLNDYVEYFLTASLMGWSSSSSSLEYSSSSSSYVELWSSSSSSSSREYSSESSTTSSSSGV